MDRGTVVGIAFGGAALAAGIALLSHRKKEKNATMNTPKKRETFSSHVTDHDGRGLVNLSPDTLWHVTARFRGNGPPWRRMIVYRPPGTTSLLLLSPTAVPDDVMGAIDSIDVTDVVDGGGGGGGGGGGTVRCSVDVLLVPNSWHRTDAAVFKDRYPGAKVASPPGSNRKWVSEVVEVDMDARELAMRYRGNVRVVRIGGLSSDDGDDAGEEDFEYAYEFRCADGTWAYAVTDTLFNFPEGGFMNWVFGCRGIVQPDGTTTPRVGRVGKFFMHSKAKCAEFYRKMTQRDDVSMILMAHGDVLVGKEKVKAAFSAVADDLCG